MKKIVSLSVFILVAVVVSSYAFSSNADSRTIEAGSVVESVDTSDASISDSNVTAYYFYTTARCVSCQHSISCKFFANLYE
ncbi:MAG: hypothetical protein KJ915_11225 [Candidatus Omnitrophica bacterium]|nr:hypothetical protein [Candidatus Omnitrophota bacterium]